MNRKWTLFTFSRGDFKTLERYLNEQAERGWELESVGIFATWKRTERRDLCWCVDLAKPRESREERLAYADLCGEAGWELAALTGQMYLFKSRPGVTPIPIQTDPELERNNYIEAVARTYSIAYEDLRSLVNRYGLASGYGSDKTAVKTVPVSAKKAEKEDSVVTSQKLLLTWLSEDVSLFSKIEPWIGPKDFTDPLCHEAAEKVFEEYHRTKTVTPARIMNLFEDTKEQMRLAAAFNTTIHDASDRLTKEKAINETVRKIKLNSLDKLSKNAKDIQTLQELVKEKAKLQKLHISL